MNENIQDKFTPVEPVMANRFLIKFDGLDVPEYNFRKYKIYNDGDQLMIKIDFMDTVNFIFNPQDMFKITGVEIKYLDPIGNILQTLHFNAAKLWYKKVNDYSLYEISINKITVQINNSTPLYKYL